MVKQALTPSFPTFPSSLPPTFSFQELPSDWPEIRAAEPKLEVGEDVVEQEVYGVDPMTYNQILDSMGEKWHLRNPSGETHSGDKNAGEDGGEDSLTLTEEEQHDFIEEVRV